MKVSISV